MKKVALLLLVLALFSVGSAWAQAPAECVTDYDATVDYFPNKAVVDYATGFTLTYHNSYKVLEVLAPFPGSTPDDGFTYVLVQCGTPAPEGFDGALFVEIPTGRVMTMSTTFLPHLTELGLLDSLVGVDSILYTSTPEVIAKHDAGELVEIGFGSGVNVELVLDAEPDLVLVNASGNPQYDAHPVLLEAGIAVAVIADYVENTPLGQAEWVKFTAAFFNADGEAQALFARKADAYNALVALTSTLPAEARRSVLWDSFSSWSGAWLVPGAQTYVAQFMRDAGVNLILGDAPEVQTSNGSVPFDFESVYEAGLEADVWIPGSFGVNTLADLLAQDERYADFTAFQNGNVITNGGRVNANGGNDYYENGVNNPQDLLADFIALVYPELLPDHVPTYFVRLSGE
jgi:iron complex transport system substrate-binding protein